MKMMPRLTLGALLALTLLACESKAPVTPPATPTPDAGAAEAPATPDAGAAATAVATDAGAAAEEDLPAHVKESRKYGHIPTAGITTPEQVAAQFGTWKSVIDKVEGDAALAERFKKVAPGAKLTVVFGTWCTDCYQTLPPIWATFKLAGEALPFSTEYIALDEQFRAGAVDITPYNIERIPTLIVSRDGKEVGRIIEQSSEPVPEELLSLLEGKKEGVISSHPEIRAKYNLK